MASARDPHLALGSAEGDLQPVHGLNQGSHAHEDVLIDQGSEALAVLLRVACPVNDPHLFDERALPALPGACRDTVISSALGGHLPPTPTLASKFNPSSATAML